MSSKPFKINKQEPVAEKDCEFDIHVDILADEITKHREEAIKSLGAQIKIDGFREGKVPEKILVDRLGEIAVIEEAGHLALEKHYSDIILATELKPIGSPKVLITKVASGEAFSVKIHVSTMPETKIADYKKVAKEVFALDKKDQEELNKKLEITDAEVDETIKNLQEQMAHQKWHDEHPDDHGHSHGKDEKGEGEDLPLPEVNDEFVAKFGPFKTVEEFRTKIAEGMKQEKARKEVEKARLTLMEKLIEKSDIKMPQMFVDSELNRMVSEMDAQIGQMGMKLEEYLKHIGKTIDDMKADWTGEATKRAKTQIIMSNIAASEKIEPKKEDVDRDVEYLMKQYPGSDKIRATIYVEQFLTNDLVWKFLEANK